MNAPFVRTFRLVPRGGAGLACDGDGVALGPVSLIEAWRDENGRLRFRTKTLAELGKAMRLAYGEMKSEVIARHHRGLSRIAELLAAGEGTRARIHAVQLGLSDIDDTGMAKLARAVQLRKINGDWNEEPRLPPGQPGGGDWTTGGASAPKHPLVPLPQPGTLEDPDYNTYGTPSNGRGQWGRERAMRVVSSVAAALAQSGQGDLLNVGNMSLENGGVFKPHKGHRDGLGIDIRPVRTDRENAPATWKSSAYDRTATQTVVDAFLATGMVSRIYFNDPDIKGVTPLAGHDNHLHVQLRAGGD